MLKFKLVLLGMVISISSFSKNQLYYGNAYGKKVFVQMREDSTATILVIQTQKSHRGCIYFLEPSETWKSFHVYQVKFSKYHRNYWVTNFMATKKNESINHLPKEKVEIGKKRSWLYIFNLPEVSVDFPLRKVLRWEYANEEYERYLK